jgi:hypothetical protein
MSFVGDEHRALMGDRFMPMNPMGSNFALTASAAAPDFTGYGLVSHALIDHGVAHATLGVCKV